MEGLGVGVSANLSVPREQDLSPVDAGTQGARKVTQVLDSDFIEFPSIFKFSFNAIKAIRSKLDSKTVFVVTEKLNGACFSFYTKGDEVRRASRTNFISDEKDFNDSSKHIGHYADKVKHLYRNACEKGVCQSGELMIVTGEYYGPAVELGITLPYPSNDFSAFSITVGDRALGFDAYRELAGFAKIPVVPEVLRGHLNDVLAVDPNTLTSALSGASKNPMPVEGVVIQTVDHLKMKFAPNDPEHPVLLKKKASQFSESEKQTRAKGKKAAQSRAKAGLKKGEQAYSQELSQVLLSKLADEQACTSGLPARISGLLSKGIVDKYQERSEEFYDAVRAAAIEDAVGELKGDPEHQGLSDELHTILDSEETYRREQLYKMLNRKMGRKRIPDTRIEEILGGTEVKLTPQTD